MENVFDLIRGSLESCHGDPVGPEQSFRWYASDVMVASKTDLVLKDGDREVEPCTILPRRHRPDAHGLRVMYVGCVFGVHSGHLRNRETTFGIFFSGGLRAGSGDDFWWHDDPRTVSQFCENHTFAIEGCNVPMTSWVNFTC